jgi:hypothetical protein
LLYVKFGLGFLFKLPMVIGFFSCNWLTVAIYYNKSTMYWLETFL